MTPAHTWTANWAQQRGLNTVVFEEIDSTNRAAHNEALNETAGQVLYLTGHQTAGKGRGANRWLDTGGGENLLSTWSISLSQSPQAISGARFGLALYRATSKTWPSLSWALKAPNDLLLEGQKIAGLLLESIQCGPNHRLLIGLGFNLANHPRSLEHGTHLLNHLDIQTLEETWFRFLDEWWSEITVAARECLSAMLTPEACQDLKVGLNLNPNLEGPVVEVLPNGDIQLTSKKIQWISL